MILCSSVADLRKRSPLRHAQRHGRHAHRARAAAGPAHGRARGAVGRAVRLRCGGAAGALVCIDDVDQRLGARQVVPPERSDAVLSADVPQRVALALELDLLGVEIHRRVRVDLFPHALLAALQLQQDGRLACRVEASNQDAHVRPTERVAHRRAPTRATPDDLRRTSDARGRDVLWRMQAREQSTTRTTVWT
jgi:hypothetical protein